MNRVVVILLWAATLMISVDVAARSKNRSESIVVEDGVQYYMHTIVKGDTMYSLVKLYDIDPADIYQANHIADNRLSIGDVLKIPSERGAVERALRRQLEQSEIAELDVVFDKPEVDSLLLMAQDSVLTFRNSVNSFVPAGLMYYTIEEESLDLNSIAESFSMSVEQLRRINDIGEEQLMEGSVILVRDESSDRATAPYTAERRDEIEEMIQGVEFRALADDEQLDVALLLPLSINGAMRKPFVEFYQGVLMGVERLKREGRNIALNIYNTERNKSVVESIISDPNYQECDLIIGPIYEHLLDDVLRDAEHRSIPVVSPLATIANSESAVLFQVAPDNKYRYDKIDSLLSDGHRITLIEGETNDEAFREEVMRVLATKNAGYRVLDYKYEHPSQLEERIREAERSKKEAIERSEEYGAIAFDEETVKSFTPEPSKSDLTPLLLGQDRDVERQRRDELMTSMYGIDSLSHEDIVAYLLDNEEADSDEEVSQKAKSNESDGVMKLKEPINHTLFILSNNEIEVDRILSALSSAYTALVATSQGRGINIPQMIKYDVVANPEWRRYKNIDRSIYFRNNVVLFSSYLSGRDSDVIREFDSNYGSAFGELPSLYSYRGYDVMMIFGEGAYSDIESGMVGVEFEPLHNIYRFERDEERATIVNKNWTKEWYRPNFSKIIE